MVAGVLVKLWKYAIEIDWDRDYERASVNQKMTHFQTIQKCYKNHRLTQTTIITDFGVETKLWFSAKTTRSSNIVSELVTALELQVQICISFVWKTIAGKYKVFLAVNNSKTSKNGSIFDVLPLCVGDRFGLLREQLFSLRKYFNGCHFGNTYPT